MQTWKIDKIRLYSDSLKNALVVFYRVAIFFSRYPSFISIYLTFSPILTSFLLDLSILKFHQGICLRNRPRLSTLPSMHARMYVWSQLLSLSSLLSHATEYWWRAKRPCLFRCWCNNHDNNTPSLSKHGCRASLRVGHWSGTDCNSTPG